MINVDFIGRCGKDCEVRTSKTGTTYLYVTVASDRWNAQTKQVETDWMDVTYFGTDTNQVAERLKKGYQVSIHGTETISAQPMPQNPGQMYIHRNVIARSVDLVYSGKKENNGGNMQPMGNFASQQPVAQPMPQQPQFAQPQAPAQPQYQQQAAAPMMPQYQQPSQQPVTQPMPQQPQFAQPQVPAQPQYQQQPQMMPFPPTISEGGEVRNEQLPF